MFIKSRANKRMDISSRSTSFGTILVPSWKSRGTITGSSTPNVVTDYKPARMIRFTIALLLKGHKRESAKLMSNKSINSETVTQDGEQHVSRSVHSSSLVWSSC